MSFSGELSTMSLPDVLQWIAQSRKTGTLLVDNGSSTRRFDVETGSVTGVRSSSTPALLGWSLVEQGLITRSVLEQAVDLQKDRSKSAYLGKVLVDIGALREPDIDRTLRLKIQENILDLLAHPQGEFHFVEHGVSPRSRVPVAIDINDVLLTSVAELDESNANRRLESIAVAKTKLAAADPTTRTPETTPPPVSSSRISSRHNPEASRLNTGKYRARIGSPTTHGVAAGATGWVKHVRWMPHALIIGAAALFALGLGIFHWWNQSTAAALNVGPNAANAESLSASGAVSGFSGANPLTSSSDLDLGVNKPGFGSSEGRVQPARAPETRIPSGELAQTPPISFDDESEKTLPDEERAGRTRNEESGSGGEAVEDEPPVDGEANTRDWKSSGDNRLDEEIVGRTMPPFEAEPEPAIRDEPPLVDVRSYVPNNPRPRASRKVIDGQASSESDEPDDSPDLVQGETIPTTPGDTDPARAESLGLKTELAPSTSEAESEGSTGPSSPALPPQQATPTKSEIVLPVLMRQPQATYPWRARKLKQEAEVALRVLVDTRGQIIEVTSLAGPDVRRDFVEAAIAAAKNAHYQPASQDGKPVKSWTTMRITFRMN